MEKIPQIIQSPRELDALVCRDIFGWRWYARVNSSGDAPVCRWLLDPQSDDIQRMLGSGFLEEVSVAVPLAADWLNQSISPIPKLHQNFDACMRILEWERQNLFGLDLSLHIHSDKQGTWAILEHPDPENPGEHQRFYGFHLDNPAIALCLALLRLHGAAFQYHAAGAGTCAPSTPIEQQEEVVKLKAALMTVSRFWYGYRQQKYAAMAHPDFQNPESSLYAFVKKLPCGESLAFESMLKKALTLKDLSELDANRTMFDVRVRVSIVSDHSIGVIIQDWKPDTLVFIPTLVLPEAVQDAIQERRGSLNRGFLELWVKANLHAETKYELYLSDFRVAVDPREQFQGIPIEAE
jgi:hypothetical protein